MIPKPFRTIAVALAGLLCFLTSAVGANQPPTLAGKRVLWLGDSITQAGTYVSFVEYLLNRNFPDQKFDIISIGLGSETVSGLSEVHHPFPRPCVHERLGRALERIKPEVVVACYGMNDGIYHPQSPERMAAFEAGIQKLIKAAHTAGATVILLTPPVFDPLPVHAKTLAAGGPDADYSFMRPFADYDSVLADYARYEMALPPADAFVIDLHTAMLHHQDAQRAKDAKFSFSHDGIHPGPDGHLLMALTILDGLGIHKDAPDLQAELAKVQADPLCKIMSQHRSTRSQGWLEYIGYTRGKTVKADSVDKAEQAATAIQQQADQLRTNSPQKPQ